jgi:hypothetical protein
MRKQKTIKGVKLPKHVYQRYCDYKLRCCILRDIRLKKWNQSNDLTSKLLRCS